MNRTIFQVILILLVALIDRSFGGDGPFTGGDGRAGHRTLIRDAVDGQLDDLSLIHASLLLSPEIDGHSEAHWLGQFQWHVRQCAAQIPPRSDDAARAEAVFAYLHHQVLTREYREDITSVGHSLRDGSYNCVSSTLLYICLCREMGLPAQAVALPNHVFVKLKLQPTILVETTYPRWSVLDPTDRRIDQIQRLREISDVALLGRFFYNQAITWAKRSEFALAVEAARLSCQFDPADHAAHANLLATINNWALHLCREGDYGQASQRVAQGLSVNSSYGPLLANDVYVHQTWIAALRREGHQRRADVIERALLERLRSRQADGKKAVIPAVGRI